VDKIVEEIIVSLYKNGLFKIGTFKLTSGKISPYYLDLRVLPSYPNLYRKFMNLAVELLKNMNIKFDAIAGIETAGIVHASYLGCLLDKPIIYIRKKPKEHGTKKLVEGIIHGKQVLLVDDVATTGGSLEHGVKAIISEGGLVRHALVLIDRLEGASQRLRKYGVELLSVLKIDEIIEVLKCNNLLSSRELELIKQYREKEARKPIDF